MTVEASITIVSAKQYYEKKNLIVTTSSKTFLEWCHNLERHSGNVVYDSRGVFCDFNILNVYSTGHWRNGVLETFVIKCVLRVIKSYTYIGTFAAARTCLPKNVQHYFLISDLFSSFYLQRACRFPGPEAVIFFCVMFHFWVLS